MGNTTEMTAQEQMIAKYGLPDAAYQARYCITWHIQEDFPWFPAKTIFINIDFKIVLFAALTKVQEAGVQNEITEFDGCFNQRNVRGSATKLSAHAFAAALDLDAAANPMVIKPFAKITPADRLGKWSQSFVDAMVSAGLFFGGNFKTRPDPMHFSMLDM